MSECPSCGVELETPLGCTACGSLFELDGQPSPFEIFGLEPSWVIDATELRRRLLRFSRIVHPDYFGQATPQERERAETSSALLNSAHEVLVDAVRRADWLVAALGGPSEADERQMPQEFLIEVLEWNETLEEARDAGTGSGSAARTGLQQLQDELEQRRGTTLRELGEVLEPLPESSDPVLSRARRLLNAIRYLDRALEQIRALRLEDPSPR
ncbi:MAG: iron-sulfur cluster co-chaperone HscB C-terminal domain-containing protein [Planctomycetota bacterium]